MEFEYFAGEQRSPEWYKIKRGRIGASSLWRWLSVSVAKGKEGKPLKERLDYEKELMFERQFDTSFEVYVNSAMQDGIDYEDFAADQYSKITGNRIFHAGTYYNDFLAASPDRHVRLEETPDDKPYDGLLEIKILKDNSFTDVLVNGVPKKHWQQIQGQLWASGLPWCDYGALNFNTGRMVIIRVYADPEFHRYLELSVQEKLVVAEFNTDVVFEIPDEVPGNVELGAELDYSDSNFNF